MFTLKKVANNVDAHGVTYEVNVARDEYSVQQFIDEIKTKGTFGNITIKCGDSVVDGVCYGGIGGDSSLKDETQDIKVIGAWAVGNLFGVKNRMDYCIYVNEVPKAAEYKPKIILHQSTIPSMDATEYWGDYPEGTTVADLIELIANEWADASGEVIVIGEPQNNIRFIEGSVGTLPNPNFMSRRINSIRATQYHNWNHTTNFSVVLD